jgi:hypothetical protein
MSHAGQNKKVATASAHADFAFATNHCRSERASCTRSLMDLAEKTTLATGFVKLHGEQNDVEIPKRLLEFFKSGECWKYEGKVLPKAELPGFDPGSFRLTVVPPSWEVSASYGGLDDAIVGEDGEWESAPDYVPIFGTEQSKFFVVDVTDPKCPVGYFEEETWQEEGDGYVNGVFMISKSLDGFLKTLVDMKEADYEVEPDEEIWDEIAEELDTDEDGDDDDDDDDDDDEDEDEKEDE